MWRHDALIHAWWVEPGLLAGEYPGHLDPGPAATKIDVLLDAGIRSVVDLTAEADGLEPYAPLLERAGQNRRLDVGRHHFPIPDNGVVADCVYDDILDAVRAERDAGRRVYVHCWGGVGRTGTVVGCHLAAGGLSSVDVLDRLAALRTGSRKAHRPCPENEVQRKVIRRRARD